MSILGRYLGINDELIKGDSLIKGVGFMMVGAILFDTRSIQRYIFSGNKLKTNIGASFIVERLFQEVLVEGVLKKRFGDGLDAESWKNESENITKLPAKCYVAYIGGGNALILFAAEEKDQRKEIVREFTRKLLCLYPGLQTGAALGELELDTEEKPNAFKDSLNALYQTLKKNQNTVYPKVNVPYTGLTLACDINGEAANFYDAGHLLVKEKEPPRFFSQEIKAKTEAAVEANLSLRKEFADHIGNHKFPMELENLGQKEAENDIAIVHIDGNKMGIRFSKCGNLAERSQLSQKIKEKTKAAFTSLLDSICEEYAQYKDDLKLEKENESYLPIRPLILGGDDVTFVCNAKMALVYAKRFIETMRKDDYVDGINCCAGIAILPTSYPFFRGYELAEQACDVAKKKSRKQDSSWLDFVILHGEQAPTLEQIRRQEYHGALGNMHFGPYRIDDAGSHVHVQKLLDCVNGLNKLPRNKVKELRSVLQHGKHDAKRFMEQLQHDGLSLPLISGWEGYAAELWSARKVDNESIYQTPYIDAIEMMDYVVEAKEGK